MNDEYDICIDISYEEACRRSKELFNKLIAEINEKYKLNLGSCEALSVEDGAYLCYDEKDNVYAVEYFYSPISPQLCLHVEKVRE